MDGFLAANNVHGFVADELVGQKHDPDSIAGRLLLATSPNELSIVQLKQQAKHLKRLFGGSVKHCHVLELLAQMAGYRSWNQVSRAARVKGVAPNLSNALKQEHLLFDAEARSPRSAADKVRGRFLMKSAGSDAR
ncbi:glyoxalase superfamily protein [Variovorax sp. J22R115]|uniref:glyoxalase superfamily protein n=1 Tax=Variovorax sp. J22R115 TaxID=3053509 RepID=UPI0025791475|nr:glyoxalase superfamily protein [Variovorax sp. J22R115]MDM0053987.1 glyoxalase superfamily protein [Variovorax sp. J22R115]